MIKAGVCGCDLVNTASPRNRHFLHHPPMTKLRHDKAGDHPIQRSCSATTDELAALQRLVSTREDQPHLYL
jgi:hypothetical protein